jgi:tRNA pseudouridine(55) synthase
MAKFFLFKPIGKTPLEVINDYKKNHTENSINKICYVYRLDPMACGQFLVLTNEDCYDTNKYLTKIDKTYRYKLLIGIRTNTLDCLGNIEEINNSKIENIQEKLNYFFSVYYTGSIVQTLPKYCGYKIKNKPLWYYANNNIDIELPVRNVHIYRNTINSIEKIKGTELKAYVNKYLTIIKGNFPTMKYLESWNTLENTREFTIVNIESKVSSGTFIRKICEDFGHYIHMPCMAFQIERLSIHLV